MKHLLINAYRQIPHVGYLESEWIMETTEVCSLLKGDTRGRKGMAYTFVFGCETDVIYTVEYWVCPVLADTDTEEVVIGLRTWQKDRGNLIVHKYREYTPANCPKRYAQAVKLLKREWYRYNQQLQERKYKGNGRYSMQG